MFLSKFEYSSIRDTVYVFGIQVNDQSVSEKNHNKIRTFKLSFTLLIYAA